MADIDRSEGTAPPGGGEYRVLARKYRPATFDELIGQDILVRTLTNAIRLNRVHHAFILTGVRGIGKTTTARLIARALNCVGPDGTGGPTIAPCGVCAHCVAIAADRDVDVLEMDAASNTGVDDVREIIDSVRYRPNAARFKVYIVDEVHMLSRNAFNALLKTLEEPPEHVKFVFATTEIRKVPVTILSRCQRFDLRRLDEAELAAHLADIAGREGAALEDEALALLARAADGSVRDGLSLLDRAIAESESGPDSDSDSGPVSAERVRRLLGLANRSQSLDLFESIMAGDAAAALDRAGAMYRDGAAPLLTIQDLMDIAHWLTRLKLLPEARAAGAGASATDAARAAALAGQLGMGALGRVWQMLLKGAGEVQLAAQPMTALEMLIVRLCYAAELPTPAELVARLGSAAGPSGAGSPGGSPSGGSPAAGPSGAAPLPERTSDRTPDRPPPARAAAAAHARTLSQAAPAQDAPPAPDIPDAPEAGPAPAEQTAAAQDAPAAADAPDARPEPSEPSEPSPGPADGGAGPEDFRAVVDLFRERREMLLHGQLYGSVHPVSCAGGRLEIRLAPGAGRDLPGRTARLLEEWTGRPWSVIVSDAAGGPTLKQTDEAERQHLMQQAAQDPLVRAVLDRFEGSALTGVSGPVAGSVGGPVAEPGGPAATGGYAA